MTQRTRDRAAGLLPGEVAFLVILARGLDARRRRIARDRDAGGISVETALIIIALIGLAGLITGAILALGDRFVSKLNKFE
jgi:hypothetical protein